MQRLSLEVFLRQNSQHHYRRLLHYAHLSGNRRYVWLARAKTQCEDNMVNVESALGAVPPLDGDLPFARFVIAGRVRRSGGKPDVQFQAVGEEFEPVGELELS